MSVVDLTRRITSDEAAYQNSLRSDCSLILVRPAPSQSACEEGSVELTVGDRIFDSATSEPKEIPADGIVLRAGQSVVVYTRETVCLPFNVFGFLSGKGKLIYHGIFISHGKIDAGFQDKLRVGLFNGSTRSIQLIPGMPICSCTFFQMETHLASAIARHATEPAKPSRPGWFRILQSFVRENWRWIVTTIVAVIAAIAAIVRAIR